MRPLVTAVVLVAATLAAVASVTGNGWTDDEGRESEELAFDDSSHPPSLTLKTPGTLMVVGGGEMSSGVRDRFLQLAGGRTARLVVIPTASGEIDRGIESPAYLFWQLQDVASVQLLHTRSREQADDPSFVKPLESATGVWLGGGDQSRLTDAYLGTALLRELRKLLDRGGVIAGTSAGASVMSALMITGGEREAKVGMGFGLVPGMVIDQHFSNRNRMSRLLGVLARHPDMVGVGVDEQTAAVIQGESLSVVGVAGVWVCLPASGPLPVRTQRLGSGDQIDLGGLVQTLIERSRTRDAERHRSWGKTPTSRSRPRPFR
jgi:cyanophycinase